MNIFIIKGLSPKCLGDIVERYKIVQALSSEYLKRCRKHINMKLISFKKKSRYIAIQCNWGNIKWKNTLSCKTGMAGCHSVVRLADDIFMQISKYYM